MVRRQDPLAPSIKATILPNSDLWCTYAACRTLKWLGAECNPAHRLKTIEVLAQRRNRDGGFSWTRGMRSDAWATFYCSQALTDLGTRVDDQDNLADWIESTQRKDGGFAMIPGQKADIWATHYGVRTSTENCKRPPRNPNGLLIWLNGCQAEDGGLTWSPAHAAAGRASDVRACFYGIAAWKALKQFSAADAPWDVRRLTRWIRQQQSQDGGFLLNRLSVVPCLWASYRASASLNMLCEQPSSELGDYLARSFSPDGPVRWNGYDLADVWAAFCWVGTAQAAEFPISRSQKQLVVEALSKMALPGGGYTYREPVEAADALAVASAALINTAAGREEPALVDWLRGCQMPNEGGIMYMPGRGAEVRCTHWALAAGAIRNDPHALSNVTNWLTDLQNPDGGFGYWEGRASDLVSTAAAVETASNLLGKLEAIDTGAVKAFVDDCSKHDGTYSIVPGAESTARSTLQALRILDLLGENVQERLQAVLARHQVASGGVAESGRRLPDLATTYEAALLCQRTGLDHLINDLTTFLERLKHGNSVSWNPMAPPTAELMPVAMATLLQSNNSMKPGLALS